MNFCVQTMDHQRTAIDVLVEWEMIEHTANHINVLKTAFDYFFRVYAWSPHLECTISYTKPEGIGIKSPQLLYTHFWCVYPH